jgi:alpha-tubulin suppressor-like RCC1 family protein
MDSINNITFNEYYIMKTSQVVNLISIGLVFMAIVIPGCISHPELSRNNTTSQPLSDENSITSLRVIAISAGEGHSLALLKNGTVIEWGSDANGESVVPNNLTDVVNVSAGWGYSVAVKKDGSVVAWGCSRDLKNVDPSPCNTPSNLTNVKSISTSYSGCVLALKNDGTVVAWGRNSSYCAVPKGLKNVTAVSAGDIRSLVLKDDGSVVAWGDYQGKIPINHKRYVGIAQDYGNILLLREDGKIDNFLGASTYHPDLSNVSAISAGLYGSCYFVALFENGSVTNWWCEKDMGWAMTPRLKTTGKNLTNITTISQGGFYTLALKNNGKMVIWGNCGWSHNCTVPDKYADYFDSIYW